jgi:hypothetical protein
MSAKKQVVITAAMSEFDSEEYDIFVNNEAADRFLNIYKYGFVRFF